MFKHRFAVAPMLGWTDKYCRYFYRLLSARAVLYTEMITTGALLYADPARFLDFFQEEKPLVLQLGGADPDELAQCAQMTEAWGYDEINLNLGCPSDRVQNGRFGACLMAEPERVADCIQAMRQAVSIPITVKHRIGIDDQEDYDQLAHFVDTVGQAGCDHFIVHARKAWLKGLNPKQNRSIPPLKYDWVYRLKQDFNYRFSLNGGIQNIESAAQHLIQLDGVMIGRAIYYQPWLLSEVDPMIYGQPPTVHSRIAAIQKALPWIASECQKGVPLNRISRHMLGLFHAQPGAKQWRRLLSTDLKGAGPERIEQALKAVNPG